MLLFLINAGQAPLSKGIGSKYDGTGRLYMKQMLSSVDKVKSSIDDISHIIGLINEIAEQTKLLALNAAIEAARAGAGECCASTCCAGSRPTPECSRFPDVFFAGGRPYGSNTIEYRTGCCTGRHKTRPFSEVHHGSPVL